MTQDRRHLTTLRNESRCPAANPGFLVHLQTQTPTRSSQSPSAHSLIERLTHAERELARCVCCGLANQEIAQKPNKSVLTVKGQLTSVYKKLGVTSRSRLLAEFAQLIY